MALIGDRLYDEPALDRTEFPNVTIGELRLNDWSSHTHAGFDGSVTINTWTQYEGKKEVHDIMARIYTLLYDWDPAISGKPTINFRQTTSSAILDEDGRTYNGFQIFSIMFGLSFLIQMDRQKMKGIDFRWKFLWRLTILFVIGYIHSLYYTGDVLAVYALFGIPLVFLYKFKNRILIWIAILLVIQIPMLYNLIFSFYNPGFEIDRGIMGRLWGEAFNTYEKGTFREVISFNIWKGQMAIWTWMYFYGRHLQLPGLFICGLLLGKVRYFENIEKYKKLTLKVLIFSLIIFSLLYLLILLLPKFELTETQRWLSETNLSSYSGLVFTATLISSFVLLYHAAKNREKIIC